MNPMKTDTDVYPVLPQPTVRPSHPPPLGQRRPPPSTVVLEDARVIADYRRQLAEARAEVARLRGLCREAANYLIGLGAETAAERGLVERLEGAAVG